MRCLYRIARVRWSSLRRGLIETCTYKVRMFIDPSHAYSSGVSNTLSHLIRKASIVLVSSSKLHFHFIRGTPSIEECKGYVCKE
jgi:hypothetical protein